MRTMPSSSGSMQQLHAARAESEWQGYNTFSSILVVVFMLCRTVRTYGKHDSWRTWGGGVVGETPSFSFYIRLLSIKQNFTLDEIFCQLFSRCQVVTAGQRPESSKILHDLK
jgi:hypothetical protein